MKRKTLGRVAAAVGVGLLSTSALAATMMANNSNKGSLLIAPLIVTSGAGGGTDTLITLTNDSSTSFVEVKCYYRTSSDVTTPGGGGGVKRTVDFGFRLTPHQTVSWSASTGTSGSSVSGLRGVAPPLSAVSQTPATPATAIAAELKCFAVTNQGTAPFINGVPASFNNLMIDVSIVGAPFGTGGQAWEYQAWAFQALVGTGSGVGTNPLTPTAIPNQGVAGNVGGAAGLPAVAVDTPFAGEATATLALNGAMYDGCPNILLASFEPAGAPAAPGIPGTGNSSNLISIASCSQDLTEANTPIITKYLYTFWNADEISRTGFFECADSTYTRSLDTVLSGTFAGLGFTSAGYVTIESIGDTTICGSRARKVGMVGVKASANGGSFVRGTNMIGRGVNNANAITYNPGTPDSFKR